MCTVCKREPRISVRSFFRNAVCIKHIVHLGRASRNYGRSLIRRNTERGGEGESHVRRNQSLSMSAGSTIFRALRSLRFTLRKRSVMYAFGRETRTSTRRLLARHRRFRPVNVATGTRRAPTTSGERSFRRVLRNVRTTS
jgi:hypothetical protein